MGVPGAAAPKNDRDFAPRRAGIAPQWLSMVTVVGYEDAPMSMFDYKSIPAPRSTRISLTPARAAEAAEEKAALIALHARDGWSFVAAEPDPDATGILARGAERLVFRRPRASRAPEGAFPKLRRFFSPARTPEQSDYEADVRATVGALPPLMARAA